MERHNWRERVKRLANGNGVWRWVAGGLLTVCTTIGFVILSDVRGDIKSNQDKGERRDSAIIAIDRRTDSLGMKIESHLKDAKVDRVLINLQLAEIAKKVNAPVVVDTTKDSVP